MKKTIATLMALLVCFTSIYLALAEDDNDSIWDVSVSNPLSWDQTTETNDTVYSNVPNGVNVYASKDEDAEVVGNIPYLWGITRYMTIGDEWSKISYEEKDCYVKTSDITTERPYEIREETYDIVRSASDGTTVYTLPDENSEIVGTIPSGWGVDRILNLTNGFSMISYNCNNYFAKTNSLYHKVYLGNYIITYYCPCSICNGPYGPYDRYGNRLVDGTAAVDPSVIPMGSTFYVEESYGLRRCVARDVGGAINGAHIDVFVDVPHNVCENMGNSRKPVYIYTACE